MLATERQHAIAEFVDQQRSARVGDLARRWSVTEETIRRDLEKLESEGRLHRRHGGAISVRYLSQEPSFIQREAQLNDEKQHIARHALQLVQEGDTLLMDASTTVLQLARMLPPVRLTVVTNSLHLLTVLAQRPEIEVISLGGRIARTSMSFLGPAAERQLESFCIDKLFLSCCGVSIEEGASDSNELEASLKRQMMLRSREHYLLADSSKFGVQALNIFAGLGDFDALITDEQVHPKLRERFQAAGLPLQIASQADLVAAQA